MIDDFIYGTGVVTLACLGGAFAMLLSDFVRLYYESAIFVYRIHKKVQIWVNSETGRVTPRWRRPWLIAKAWNRFAWDRPDWITYKDGTRVYWPGVSKNDWIYG